MADLRRVARTSEGVAIAGCLRCGASPGQPCHSVTVGNVPISKCRGERGRSNLELLTDGYVKCTLVDDSRRRPLTLWRRRTQRPIIRTPLR
jgi:hypothetical protein